MKRLRLSAILVAVLAVVSFVPTAAQNAAKRAMDLEDVLAFRALSTVSMSPNGQWLAYRMAPLPGDSEVIVRAATGGRDEIPGR
jgi:hypothetical protein